MGEGERGRGDKGTGFEIRVLGTAGELQADCPGRSAGCFWGFALTSYHSPSLFLTEARSWGGVSSTWESGDLRAGLGPPFPWSSCSWLSSKFVSKRDFREPSVRSSILQTQRGSLTHYSPIISLLPTVLWAVPSPAVLPLSKAIISRQLLKIPSPVVSWELSSALL